MTLNVTGKNFETVFALSIDLNTLNVDLGNCELIKFSLQAVLKIVPIDSNILGTF